MSRSDRQYGCKLRRKNNAKRTELENKINDESKKTSSHTYNRHLVLRMILALCVIKKAQGSAPRAADAARYVRARKNATKTYTKRRKEARDLVRIIY